MTQPAGYAEAMRAFHESFSRQLAQARPPRVVRFQPIPPNPEAALAIQAFKDGFASMAPAVAEMGRRLCAVAPQVR